MIGLKLEKLFQTIGNWILKITNTYITYIENFNLTNKQWYLDWEDELNKYSVKNHNKPASE